VQDERGADEAPTLPELLTPVEMGFYRPGLGLRDSLA
jgi:hypothetical protein